MRVLILTILFLSSIVANAKTYSANIPEWRGEWIWTPRKSNAPVLDVNLRRWVVARPGGWGQSIVNRILGNAAISGIEKIVWRLDDGKGNALFPASQKDMVLKWTNWGFDFSLFDFPAAANKFAKRCGMKITFVCSAKFIKEAKKRYPDFVIQETYAATNDMIMAEKLNPAKTAAKWLSHKSAVFKKEFTLSSKVRKAELCITADAVYRLYVDGKEIGCDGDWWRGETYDITALLSKGKHEIKVIVKPSKIYAGLLLNLRYKLADGSKHELNSGADWICRIVDTKDWQPVSIVGYEGTGPRFRLKDVWKNKRQLVCNLKNVESKVSVSEMKLSSKSNPAKVNKAADNSMATFWASKGTGAVLNIDLTNPVLVSEIRIFSGNPDFSGFPSGSCALKDYKIQYYDNGEWKNLVEPVRDMVSTNRYCHAFSPRKVDKIRIVINKSHDTLKRTTGEVAPSKMSGIIREVEVIKALGR